METSQIPDGLPSVTPRGGDVPGAGQAPRTLVIYAGDASYAYPMLASARSVRLHSGAGFDITIFATDYTTEEFDRASAVGEAFGVKLAPLSSAEYMRFDPARYQTERDFAHLRPSVLSRLVTGRSIPAHYDQVLYLDGDTLCTGDLSPLINFQAPPGRLVAVPDSINHLKHNNGRYAAVWRSFMQDVGLSVDDTWYNTGVMMADRETWIARCDAALAYFIEHTDACRFPVDGSTNATAKGYWASISCRWNFMAPMRMWGLDAAVSPRLYHFTGKEKPWLGRVDPWRDFWPRYEALRADGALGELATPAAPGNVVDAINRRRIVARMKDATVFAHRVRNARRSLLALEEAALV